MGVIEQLQADVMTALDTDIHGRKARYVALATSAAFTIVLNADITTTAQTTANITTTGAPPMLPYLVKLDSEIVLWTAQVGSVSTISRGQNGTTVAIHTASGATVSYAGVQLGVMVDMDNWKSVFDSGTIDIDFNLMPCTICANDIATMPVEQGRGGAGDTIVFDDFPATTWHVRMLNQSAEYAGSYYGLVITDYNGPMTGV